MLWADGEATGARWGAVLWGEREEEGQSGEARPRDPPPRCLGGGYVSEGRERERERNHVLPMDAGLGFLGRDEQRADPLGKVGGHF